MRARPRVAVFVGLGAIVAVASAWRGRSAPVERALPLPASMPSAASAPPLPASAPTMRLLVATDLDGTLEPCGCTRDQLGGVDRLAAAVTEERAAGVPTLFLTAGDLFFTGETPRTREPPLPDQWRAQTLAEVLRGLGLDAAGMGPVDVQRGRATLAALAEQAGFSWISSGLLLEREAHQALATAEAHATAPLEPLVSSELRTVGDWRVGIVGLLTRPKPDWPSGVRGAADPLAATLAEIRKLREQHADLIVALAHGDAVGIAKLAGPGGADFVVASGADFLPGANPNASG